MKKFKLKLFILRIILFLVASSYASNDVFAELNNQFSNQEIQDLKTNQFKNQTTVSKDKSGTSTKEKTFFEEVEEEEEEEEEEKRVKSFNKKSKTPFFTSLLSNPKSNLIPQINIKVATFSCYANHTSTSTKRFILFEVFRL